ncbi:MAG: biotin-dependent carboxyltransferase family protein [Cyclobacteriaceae bacterium]|nr:biotin-dependent carboxyltransferase family protein [Cyclobacteriaceae bacterium]
MKHNLQIQVLKPGLHTTIQDQGRWGHMAYGVPRSGAMSVLDAVKANWLVGNPPNAPVLEITLMGPTLALEGGGQIALAGAPIKATLDQQPISHLQTVNVLGQQTLKFGRTKDQCRTYLAIRGDWKVASWLDSVSAAVTKPQLLTPQSILTKGLLWVVESQGQLEIRQIHGEPPKNQKIRVMPGPEYSRLNVQSITDFLTREFIVSAQSNRMGYRLDGTLNNFTPAGELISSGIVPGTIQVTNRGQLIVLMADAQTTGGYPRIANVIAADLPRMAQLRPGDPLQFSLVSLSEAQRALSRSKF